MLMRPDHGGVEHISLYRAFKVFLGAWGNQQKSETAASLFIWSEDAGSRFKHMETSLIQNGFNCGRFSLVYPETN